MKKSTTLFIAFLISAISLICPAEVITADVAKETADNFIALDNEWHHDNDAKIDLVDYNDIPAYYIVEYKAGGWVIVSAQSSSTPIIGYSTTGKFATPETMSELLNFNAKIITARANDFANNEHVGWKKIKQGKAANEDKINTTPDIAPLITLNLNQSFPFNAYCPTDDGFTSSTGCVAVAMAQAMSVHRYPSRANGSHTYTSENTGIHSINYDKEAEYDWDAIYNYEQDNNFLEVARLMYHVGVSVDMQYGLMGSGALIVSVPQALTSHFGYDKKTVYYTTKTPDDNEWLNMILHELANGRAIIYGGSSSTSGHCWNIDGWKQSTQMVHCNWGWAGIGNGYFSLDNMTDSYQGSSFLYNQGAVFGVTPPTSAPYEIILSNTQYAIGTEAGTILSYIETVTTDKQIDFNYELSGPENVQTPYQIVGNQLIANEPIEDNDKFRYLHIKATNAATGESYEKNFDIRIVAVNTHKLLGIYNAHAQSAFSNYPDEDWQINIQADKENPAKVWMQPICIFGGLAPESICPLYAIYDEEKSTLTMPIGQVVYETGKNKMITGISRNNHDIETTGDITLQVTLTEDDVIISFASDYVFGIGNEIGNKWWYQVLTNIVLDHKDNSITAPYDIVLSNTTYAIGTAINAQLADISVLCDDRTALFDIEIYGQGGTQSPYKVVDNALVLTQPIADSETFKSLSIKATNILTGESYEKEFDLQIVENMSAIFEGTYEAYSMSGINNPDEQWQVSITADANEPNKIWIHPVFLFSNFASKDLLPVYALYDVTSGILNLPLGQITHEQQGYYQFIIGASTDGKKIDTSGNLQLQVIQTDTKMVILFNPNYVLGIGNAIGNSWWYQALHNITYIRETGQETEVDGIYYNITSEEQRCVEVTYRGNKHNEYNNEYSGSVVIPSTITLNGATYNVTSIGEFAFAHCTDLTHVTIPSSITTIGEYAFAHCTGLTQICVDNTTPPYIHERTFLNVDRATEIIVPIGCIETYKTTQYWDEFTTINDYTGIKSVNHTSDFEVITTNGRIVITGVPGNIKVTIYSVSGSLLHSTNVDNVANITLPRGIYLVQIEDTIRKIVL